MTKSYFALEKEYLYQERKVCEIYSCFYVVASSFYYFGSRLFLVIHSVRGDYFAFI